MKPLVTQKMSNSVYIDSAVYVNTADNFSTTRLSLKHCRIMNFFFNQYYIFNDLAL